MGQSASVKGAWRGRLLSVSLDARAVVDHGAQILGRFESDMATGGKLSKTARASLGKDKDSIQQGKACPQCTTPMVATRVIKSAGMPGGMYWVCPKDDYRMKT